MNKVIQAVDIVNEFYLSTLEGVLRKIYGIVNNGDLSDSEKLAALNEITDLLVPEIVSHEESENDR